MSTGKNEVKSCPIPTRVLTLKDWSQLPDCYSQTPGGTLFSTTPGGTRIIYDRKFLLDCRNSPLARTPPCCLPQIPGVTVPATHPIGKLQDLKEEAEEEEKDVADDNQFEMDIWTPVSPPVESYLLNTTEVNNDYKAFHTLFLFFSFFFINSKHMQGTKE